MLQLSLNDVRVSSEEALASARQEFAERRCIFLKSFLSPSVLRQVSALFKGEQFYTRVDHDSEGQVFVREHTLTTNHPLANLMFVLLNQEPLFKVIESVTEVGKTLRYFRSRVYEFTPDPEHYDSWHDDHEKDQLIGLSVNLSEDPIDGGEFELREVESGEVLQRITESQFGDAHLFKIGQEYEHRVLPVRGTVPRRSCAGWFCPKPDYRKELKEMMRNPLPPKPTE